MRKFPVLMALVFALLLASVAVASDPTPAPIGPGELAPSVEFAMLDGDPMRLADLRGRKIVVLAFWESWSRKCQLALRLVDSLASNYQRTEVEFLAVNVREDKATVKRFASENQLKLRIALDQDGSAGKAFGAELPLLVVVGKDGIVRTIHRGYDLRLSSKLLEDLDALLEGNDRYVRGEDIPKALVAADTLDPEETSANVRRFSSSPIHEEEEDFVINLESGETLDLRAVFTKQGQEFEEDLHRLSNHRNALRTRYGDGKIMVMRLGTRLHGPTAAYYRNGSPMIYLNYEKGKRSGTLFTWDEQGRPWVFAEYKSGRKHGLSVVFRACDDACTTGHVWLVQEWQRGKLEKSHLVGESTIPLTIDHAAETDDASNEAYKIAFAHFEEFESQIKGGEEELRVEVARHGAYEARARRAARTARAQASVQSQGFAVRSTPVRRCSSGGG